MSRSGYVEDIENWDLIRWRGQVTSSIRGARGQKFLRDLIAALDALPEQRLIAGDLVRDGEYCAIGSVGYLRQIADLEALDPDDHSSLSEAFNIAEPLVREVEFVNDEMSLHNESPEDRFARVRAWAVENLNEPNDAPEAT